jgi:hypothetical protein
MSDELKYLRLLSIFHYVLAGISALFACIPLLHIILGIMMVFSPERLFPRGDAPPQFLGWLFLIFGSVAILAGWAFAVCVFLAGRFLSRKVYYYYCLVMAGIECTFAPFGTVLGVLSIIMLIKPSVKELFIPNTVNKTVADETKY